MTSLQSLALRVKLATLTTGAWRPYRLHRGETATERARHNTDAVNVRVRLTDSKALRAIVAHYETVGRKHRRLTLPTPSGDMRMLVSGRELEHTEMMRDAAHKYEHFVDTFMLEYPAIRANAPATLGSLYEPDAWPEPDIVRSRFRLQYRYLACPTGGAWDDWLNEAAALARDSLREQLRDALTTYSDRLRTAERLHGSVTSGISEACAGIAEAEEFADSTTCAIAFDALHTLPLDIEGLRLDKELRKEAAAKAQSILDSFGGVSL